MAFYYWDGLTKIIERVRLPMLGKQEQKFVEGVKQVMFGFATFLVVSVGGCVLRRKVYYGKNS